MNWTVIAKVLIDISIMNGAILIAFLLRLGFPVPNPNWEAYIFMLPWINISAFSLLTLYNLYTPGRRLWKDIFSSIICVVVLLFLVTLALSFLFYQFAFPRSVLIVSALLQLGLLSLWRYYLWNWTNKKLGPMKLILVGPEDKAIARALALRNESKELYAIQGIITEQESTGKASENHCNHLGTYANFEQIIDQAKPQALLFSEDIAKDLRNQMLEQTYMRNIVSFLIPDIHDILLIQSQATQEAGLPLFKIKEAVKKPQVSWKRLIDITLVMLLAIPALLLIALASLTMIIENPKAPLLFRQDRVGHNGKVFRLLKLRTMIPDAEKSTGPVLATEKDPRITRVGRFLRTTRIDELPQLWNVFIGDMSFIGPRPERPFFVEQFEKDIHGYQYRHQIMVGITGLAQVEGRYSTAVDDKLRYDLLYAKTVSPSTDARILLHTLKVMLLKDKAS
ncbi:sugar transferase [Heliorestis convoluta]|uniref:Exopolysaccharide biosynthesis polyprenyl glycosylphosphotransferase family protein n=1 Tax=Heliorestis convoluta TaxID=356322 RepID=A0A5Q2MX31_9FIRM|nr:sugar transferase [Heliorestis convoluta]QGG47194.1 exopolysaccharide biosynthesis polyprenyl glycosylphosphotransferase family protein [Heliorestis convoluta]